MFLELWLVLLVLRFLCVCVCGCGGEKWVVEFGIDVEVVPKLLT